MTKKNITSFQGDFSANGNMSFKAIVFFQNNENVHAYKIHTALDNT